MSKIRIKTLLAEGSSGARVAIQGWVRTKRDTKNVVFLEINDGSCLSNIQAVFLKEGADDGDVERISTGASVEASGLLVDSQEGNRNLQRVELQVEKITLIGESPADYPLQKKRHSFEYLREIAHLRPRTNTIGAVARVRNAMGVAVHQFFQDRGFIHVHTPVISISDAEGAGEMFRVTTHPAAGGLARADEDPPKEFFGRPAYLTVSGQLEAEIYALALRDVYAFGPTFRAENSNTARHLAEFWMIEPEMAFCDLGCNMDVAEEFLKFILAYVLDHCIEDMEFFDERLEKGIIESLRKVIDAEFVRISYSESIERLQTAEADFEFRPVWGHELQSEHERFLTERLHDGPVIVTDYPSQTKAFYMKRNQDTKTVRAMDILVPRLGEIIGGSQREDDVSVLTERMAEQGLDREQYWWYLELRRYGSVPHSGFGLGFERLIQYVTGMQNIRDVIPFPRSVNNADF